MNKLVTIAVRDEGQVKVFRIDPEHMSTDQIREIVKTEVPKAHPILIGVTGGKTTPAGNDGTTEPEVA